jgi:hypothetical protein
MVVSVPVQIQTKHLPNIQARRVMLHPARLVKEISFIERKELKGLIARAVPEVCRVEILIVKHGAQRIAVQCRAVNACAESQCHILRLASVVMLSTPPLFNVLYAWQIAH